MSLGLMRQIATVQCYIHHVKGVEVQIAIPQTIREITLLKQALRASTNYLK